MIDKDARLFGKINIIDFFIILLIAAAAFFIGGTLLKEDVPSAQDKGFVLKFYVEAVENFTAEGLKVGDNLYDDSKNLFLGEITELDIGEAVIYNPDQKGNTVKSSKAGYSSVEITTELNAQPFENGILISGNRYGIGHSLTIRAGKSFIYLRISGLSEKSEV